MNSEDELGQFIPLHYHYHMLRDRARMSGFRRAIAASVLPGAKVLEFGGGTGVLSFFAAQQASHVWCVERNPELVNEARRLLPRNPST
jgi:type I protein arginine methyltransferase